MIVLLDLIDGRHFQTLVTNHNGQPVTLSKLIENIGIHGGIKITSGDEDYYFSLDEIKRIGFSIDSADGATS